MSCEKEFKQVSDEHFITLVLRFQEGDLSAEEIRVLNRELHANPQRLAEFTGIQSTSRLIHEAQGQALESKDLEFKKSISWKRVLLPLAACLALLLGMSVWKFKGSASGEIPPKVATSVALDSRWKLVAADGAKYSIVQANRVRLEKGELEFSSSEPADLVVETPYATASAKGSHFLIGHHSETRNQTNPKITYMKTTKTLSRILVLAGMVSMSNDLGTVQAGEKEAVIAEAAVAPVKIAIQANNDFAFDLYQQLAKEKSGENLFFSPYSISSALAMTAEGARGETAYEMGKVLRFPEVAMRIGDDAQRIPWETSLIHTGMSELNRRFSGMDSDPDEVAKIRTKIANLRKELDAWKMQMAQWETDKKWDEWHAGRDKEEAIVAKLNAEAAKVDQYEIHIANALWGEQSYPFDPNFIETINKHYKTGGIFAADFENNFEAERVRINSWVEEQTKERVKDLLPEESLSDLTRLVLTNAIYFKGDWSVPFDEKNTREHDFILAGGGMQKTDLMHAPKLNVCRYGAFNADGSRFRTPENILITSRDSKKHYPTADGFAIIELPYKGEDLSMVVIAPNDPNGLPAIERKLTPDNLNTWISQLKKRDTHVYLPKFKMETDYELCDETDSGTLQKMGMLRAFRDYRHPKGAQFDGITTSNAGLHKLHISGVFHKAFVEVNEKGTEAAAATAVVMSVARSGPMSVPFIPEFKADRPFVYLIREKSTGSILFLGRMMKTSKGL